VKAARTPPQTPAKRVLPAPLNILECIDTEPEELDFVVPGLLKGTVASLVSAGGVGKSNIAMHAAFDIAIEAVNLLGFDVKRHGRVVILAGEDPKVILHQRVKAIASRLNKKQQVQVAGSLQIRECVGQGIDIMDADWYELIREACMGARLVIIDTLSRFHSLDENDSKDAKAVMAAMERLAKETGAAVLFLHHISKGAALNGMADLQQAARGSSVFVDNARWVSFVMSVSPDEAKALQLSDVERRRFIRFGVSKQNYGVPVPDQWYERVDQGVLVPSGGPVRGGVQKPANDGTGKARGRSASGLPLCSKARN
jgi:RecA-family ATPase